MLHSSDCSHVSAATPYEAQSASCAPRDGVPLREESRPVERLGAVAPFETAVGRLPIPQRTGTRPGKLSLLLGGHGLAPPRSAQVSRRTPRNAPTRAMLAQRFSRSSS